MELLLKLFAVATVVSLLTLSLKKYQPEISLSLSILATILVLVLGSSAITTVAQLFGKVIKQAGILPELLTPLLKVLAITILTKLSVDICKESGCLGLSTGIELIGNAVAITTAAPLIFSMISFLTSI